jgi:hypothetical protein
LRTFSGRIGCAKDACDAGQTGPARLRHQASPSEVTFVFSSETVKNVFVGNLDCTSREDDLQKLFEAYGAVASTSIVRDGDRGNPRGFAFAERSDRPGRRCEQGSDRHAGFCPALCYRDWLA